MNISRSQPTGRGSWRWRLGRKVGRHFTSFSKSPVTWFSLGWFASESESASGFGGQECPPHTIDRRLSEPVFQFDATVGFLVAVFHNHRSVEREIPFGSGTFFHGARARDDYGIFRNFERGVCGGAIDFTAH